MFILDSNPAPAIFIKAVKLRPGSDFCAMYKYSGEWSLRNELCFNIQVISSGSQIVIVTTERWKNTQREKNMCPNSRKISQPTKVPRDLHKPLAHWHTPANIL